MTFSMPKAMIGKYEIPGTGIRSPFCNVTGRQPSLCAKGGQGSTFGHMAILCLAQFIMGAGTTPLYTLGPAYLDENVNPKMSPIYVGIFYATTFFGPGLGFAVGGAFSRIFTNVKLVSFAHCYLC